jgi:hypothetical protein
MIQKLSNKQCIADNKISLQDKEYTNKYLRKHK